MFLIFIILWNSKSWLDNFFGVLKNVNMNGIYFRDILLIIISSGANNCGRHSLEKNIYFIMRFSPHSQLFYFNDRLEFCEFIE